MTRVTGIDPSLTGTGLAVLTSTGGRVDTMLRTVGSTGKRSDTWAMRGARLTKLRNETMRWVPRDTTLAVMEGPAYGVQGSGIHDRAGYWWMLYQALTALKIPVAVCPPTTRAKWATDKGNSGKADVAVAVSRLWPVVEWRGDDEADALALASMGAQHIGMPVPYMVLERHKLAVSKIEWP